MAGGLGRFARVWSPKSLDPALLAIAGTAIAVRFRRHAGARRLVLRLSSDGTAALVTVPKGVSRNQALDFVRRSEIWLAEHLGQRGETIRLAPGQVIPLRGLDHEIRHVASRRGTVVADPGASLIHVAGSPEHVARRLLDWLKTAARAELSRASRKYAEAMQVKYRRLSIRDQRSRWGSCSASGDLSYSWRLILAPAYVLDYVAAHEVAHLRHLNHGPAFWRMVLTHCPEASRAKKWLKLHGQSVHRVVT
ncbi:MAG: M48 family metallopeptidase [Rhizobiales bacterium]|nr:M48 family metallopeptidase [Hyphomicrobiales bacterium]MBI3673029.1 M48 family metallopeptidase [Hyphomicrobiales bacterium]